MKELEEKHALALEDAVVAVRREMEEKHAQALEDARADFDISLADAVDAARDECEAQLGEQQQCVSPLLSCLLSPSDTHTVHSYFYHNIPVRLAQLRLLARLRVHHRL